MLEHIFMLVYCLLTAHSLVISVYIPYGGSLLVYSKLPMPGCTAVNSGCARHQEEVGVEGTLTSLGFCKVTSVK